MLHMIPVVVEYMMVYDAKDDSLNVVDTMMVVYVIERRNKW